VQLSEADGNALPRWLHFERTSSLLEGVPGVSDTRSFTLKIIAVDSEGRETVADQFNIAVIEDNEAASAGETDKLGSVDDQLPRPVRCLPTSAVTTATVVIDTDAEAASGADSASTVREFARHLDLPVSAVRYLPAGKAPLDDSSALVAGAGDHAGRGSPTAGVVLQWEVGCGNVFAAHMDRLQRVETTAADGTMSTALGHGVVGWHVANKKPTTTGSRRQHRQRRAAHRLTPTATAVVSLTPPTSRPVPTHTVKDPQPTRVPPSRLAVTTESTMFPTTISERRRTRRRRSRRPRPGRSTSPVVSEPSISTTTGSYTVRPPYIESSVTEVASTRQVITFTPPLPPLRGSDLRWSGRPLHVDLYSNEILNRKIPDDLFLGGAPGRLHLRLLTADGLMVSQWLRLDDATNVMVGMPLDTHIGRQTYTLEAKDSTGLVARGTVIVEVRRKTAASHNAAFESAAKIGLDFDHFTEDMTLRLDVVKKIAGGFGDPDFRQLAVMGIAPGSVVISWTNSSIPGDSFCPMSTLVDIRSRMLAPDGSVNPRFREALRPYQVIGATMTPRGSCASANLMPTQTTSTRSPEPAVPQKVTDRGYVLNVIVPIVIVICCIILALIIACILIRKRRHAQKASSPDKTVKPGAPVIFASELDDNGTAPPSKPLIGLNGERAPAPPDYLAATAGTPPVHDHRRPLLADSSATEQMSPLRFQPPPGSAVKQTGVHSSSRR